MALVLADRVNETTTTAGTGTLTLAGAVSGYQSFSVIGNANTTYYTIVHQTANEWEVGIGTYTSAGTTLSRDTVLASSAGGTTKVTFSAGTKFVFCDYPAGKAIYQDASGNVGVGTTSPVSRLQVSGTTPALTLSDTSASAGSYSNLLFRNTDGLGTAYNIGSVLGLTTANGGNGALTFYTAASNSNTEKMRITAAGNVGIGTTTPSAFSGYRWLSLDAVNGSGIGTRVNAVDAFWLWSSATDTRFEDLQNKPLLFLINSSEKMRIDTSGNVGIGTSSPGTKLDVNGTVRIRAGNTLYFQNAAADANGTITASGGSGSSDLAINASGGNVGIGTSSPSQKLNVATASGNAYMRVERASQATGQVGLQIGGGTSGTDWLLYQPTSSNDFRLFGNSADRVVVTSAGNVTINAPSSGESLTVNTVAGSGIRATAADLPRIATVSTGVNAVTLAMRSYDAGPFGIVGTMSNHALNFRTNDVGRMVIDTSGNVGIGTSSPAYNLEVSKSQDSVTNAAVTNASSGTGAQTRLRLNNGGSNFGAITHTGASFTTSGVFRADGTYVYGNGTGGLTLVTGATQPIYFGIANNEVARFDTSGNLGIGTSSPAYKLDVNGLILTRGSSSGLAVTRRDTDALSWQWYSAAGNFQAYSHALGGDVVTMTAAGNLGIGTTSPFYKLSFAIGTNQVVGQYASSTHVAGNVGSLGIGINDGGGAASGVFVYNTHNGTYSSQDIRFLTAQGGVSVVTERMRIDPSGNVGIGISSPGAKLDVQGSSSDQIRVRTAGTEFYRFGRNSSTGFLDFYGSQTGYQGYTFGGIDGTWMTINASGNLGLGVTPSAWDTTASRALQLNGGSLWGYSTSQINLMQNAYYDTAGNFVYVNTAAASGYRQISGTHRWITAASGTAGTTATFTTSMLIDGSGNLGIGTTSPSYKLHVSNGGAAGVEINPTGGINSGAFLQCYNRSTSVYVPFTTYASEMYWSISGAEKMRLDTSGNLGIGVAPTTPFQVQRNGYNTTAGWYSIARIINTAGSKGLDLGYNNGNNNATLTAYSNGTASGFEFWRWTGSAWEPSWIMDSSGNLGIGTTSPTAILHAKATNPVLRLEAATDSGYVDYTTTRLQLSAGGGAMYFVTGNAERARIDGSGNLLVGTTSASGRLTVRQDSTTASPLYIVNAAVSGKFASFEGNGAVQGSITWSGSTTAYNTTSDQRLKENITDADSASDLIDSIKVRQFDWKADSTHQRYGMIAQELHEVAPEAVYAPEDPDAMMAVDYSKLVPMLIKEIQSLRQRVAQLEEK